MEALGRKRRLIAARSWSSRDAGEQSSD